MTVVIIPKKRLRQPSVTNAELGMENRKQAGYIKGIAANLEFNELKARVTAVYIIQI